MFSKGIYGIVGGIVAGVSTPQNETPIPSGPFNPLAFRPSAVWDLNDMSSLFQTFDAHGSEGFENVTGEIPVTSPGDPVGFIADLTGNGNCIVTSGSRRMILSSRFEQNILQDDYIDDLYNWGFDPEFGVNPTGTFVSVGPFGVEIATLDAITRIPRGQWYYRQFYPGKILTTAQINYLREGLTDLYSDSIGDYIAEMTTDIYNDSWFETPDPAPGGLREIVFSDAQVADGPPWLTNDLGDIVPYTNTITGLIPNQTTFKIAGSTTPELVTQFCIDIWDTNTTLATYVNPSIYPVLETYAYLSRTQGPLPKNFNGWPSTLRELVFNSSYSWGRVSTFSNAPFANSLTSLGISNGLWTGKLDLSPLKALNYLTVESIACDELIMNGCTSIVTADISNVNFSNVYINNCTYLPVFPIASFNRDASITVKNCDTIDNIDFDNNDHKINLIVENCQALTSVETEINDGLSSLHYDNLPLVTFLVPGGYVGDGNSGSGRCNKFYMNRCDSIETSQTHITGANAFATITNCSSMLRVDVLSTVDNSTITVGDCENITQISINAHETTINLYNLPALTSLELSGSGD